MTTRETTIRYNFQTGHVLAIQCDIRGETVTEGNHTPQRDSETTQPTPLPWRVGGHPQDDSGSDWRQILADTQPFGPVFVGSSLKADAQLIVRAVNNHARLAAALEDAKKTIHDMTWNRRVSGRACLRLNELTARLDAALARARE